MIYKAGDNKLLITLNLKKDKLLEMMEDYPEARRFYMERAWSRRIEFRRRQKFFIDRLKKEEEVLLQFNMKSQSELEDETLSDDDDSILSDNEDQQKLKMNLQISDHMSKKVSKFYYNINMNQELEHDVDTDELE